uniref:Uncharacterized protein n=1 Tax=Oryza nivara TaxID=4536 RepID=A0A0E0GPG1_ORYNI
MRRRARHSVWQDEEHGGGSSTREEWRRRRRWSRGEAVVTAGRRGTEGARPRKKRGRGGARSSSSAPRAHAGFPARATAEGGEDGGSKAAMVARTEGERGSGLAFIGGEAHASWGLASGSAVSWAVRKRRRRGCKGRRRRWKLIRERGRGSSALSRWGRRTVVSVSSSKRKRTRAGERVVKPEREKREKGQWKGGFAPSISGGREAGERDLPLGFGRTRVEQLGHALQSSRQAAGPSGSVAQAADHSGDRTGARARSNGANFKLAGGRSTPGGSETGREIERTRERENSARRRLSTRACGARAEEGGDG